MSVEFPVPKEHFYTEILKKEKDSENKQENIKYAQYVRHQLILQANQAREKNVVNISLSSLSVSLNLFLYFYVCVCVCVCVYHLSIFQCSVLFSLSGKNLFLGILSLVVAVLCFILSVGFFIVHLKTKDW